jgi:phosphoglycolate phosphatase-like HAD superfamily hydrolase
MPASGIVGSPQTYSIAPVQGPPDPPPDQLPDAVLFDVDGTLIDTGGAGARSWAWAFEQLVGHPVDIGAYTDAGMTDPEVGRLTFERDQGRKPTARELGRLMGLYLAILPDNVQASTGYRVLPGVPDLLTRLPLERGEEIAGRRLEPRRVFVVGDTPLDIKAAHGAGLIGIGVATHNHSVEQLAEAQADHVLADLTQPLPAAT